MIYDSFYYLNISLYKTISYNIVITITNNRAKSTEANIKQAFDFV